MQEGKMQAIREELQTIEARIKAANRALQSTIQTAEDAKATYDNVRQIQKDLLTTQATKAKLQNDLLSSQLESAITDLKTLISADITVADDAFIIVKDGQKTLVAGGTTVADLVTALGINDSLAQFVIDCANFSKEKAAATTSTVNLFQDIRDGALKAAANDAVITVKAVGATVVDFVECIERFFSVLHGAVRTGQEVVADERALVAKVETTKSHITSVASHITSTFDPLVVKGEGLLNGIKAALTPTHAGNVKQPAPLTPTTHNM